MYILGWDIDFGHMEAVNLIASPKYSEKQIVSTWRFIALMIMGSYAKLSVIYTGLSRSHLAVP